MVEASSFNEVKQGWWCHICVYSVNFSTSHISGRTCRFPRHFTQESTHHPTKKAWTILWSWAWYYDLGHSSDGFIQAFGLSTKWILDQDQRCCPYIWEKTFQKYPGHQFVWLPAITVRTTKSCIMMKVLSSIFKLDFFVVTDTLWSLVVHIDLGSLNWGSLSGLPLGVNRHCNTDPLSHRSSTWYPLWLILAWKENFVIDFVMLIDSFSVSSLCSLLVQCRYSVVTEETHLLQDASFTPSMLVV